MRTGKPMTSSSASLRKWSEVQAALLIALYRATAHSERSRTAAVGVRYTPIMNFPVDLPPHLLALAQQFGIVSEDIEEHETRGHGHGGQKINKTSSCVQLRHVPTGEEVRCQEHREQSKNRVSAYTLLIEKLAERFQKSASEHTHQELQKQADIRRKFHPRHQG